jgi:hypothetical protein
LVIKIVVSIKCLYKLLNTLLLAIFSYWYKKLDMDVFTHIHKMIALGWRYAASNFSHWPFHCLNDVMW